MMNLVSLTGVHMPVMSVTRGTALVNGQHSITVIKSRACWNVTRGLCRNRCEGGAAASLDVHCHMKLYKHGDL